MTPEQLAQSNTEAAHQTAVFCWAALNVERYPELKWMYHIPNGGSRGTNRNAAMRQGGKLKAQGVKVGVSDICLPVKRGNWSGLYIEMKKPDHKPKRDGSKGGVSDDQAAFGLFVQSQGYGFVVCYSWVEAVTNISDYLEVQSC